MNANMKIYEMNLLKKTTSIERTENNTVEHPYFWVMGHFDLMSVEAVGKFSNILEYHEPKEINKKKYMRYSMYIYDPSCESCCSEQQSIKLLDKQYTENNIFLISALKINLPPNNKFYAESRDWLNGGNVFFRMIKDKIKEINNNDKFRDITIEVYICTGSFDIVAVASTTKFNNDFCNFAASLWNITYDSEAGKKKVPLFLSINSFIAVGNNYNLNNLKSPYSEPFDISIRQSLSTMTRYDEIVENYKKIFQNNDGGKDFGAPLIFGEHDVNIFINNCSIEKLFYINGIRNYNANPDGSDTPVKPPVSDELLDDYIDFQKDIKMSYTQIKYNRLPMLKNEGYIEDIWTAGENSEKVKELKELYAEAGEYIPVGCERILKLLISKCIYMLETKHRCIAGLRMYRIITTVLRHIKSEGDAEVKNPDNDSYINNCIGNIMLTIDVVMQSDNIQLDFIDDDDIQTLNPSTKFMYAYEYMLCTFFRFLDKRDGVKPLITLSMNPTKFISSQRYTRNNDSVEDIIDVNIPNAEYYNPDQWPYMAHELAHYLKTTKKKNTDRNKVFLEMVKDYILLQMMNKNKEIFQSSRAKTIETTDFIIQVLESYKKFDFKEEPSEFINHCKLYIETLHEKLTEITGAYLSYRKYEWLSDELNVMITNRYIIFDILKEIIREARADIIMYELCEMNISKYISMMKKQFNMLDTLPVNEPYNAYSLRMIAVLFTLCKKNENLLLQEVYNLDKKLSDFIAPVVEEKLNFKEFLSDLCDYLIMVRESVKISINENKEALHLKKIFMDYSKINPENPEKSIYETITQLMNQWYNSLHYMEDEKVN